MNLNLKKKKPIILAVSIILSIGVATALLPTVRNYLYPDAVTTSAAKRKLPIYCVDTQGKPQISISFDAAWGAGNSRRNFYT